MAKLCKGQNCANFWNLQASAHVEELGPKLVLLECYSLKYQLTLDLYTGSYR
jgi:hypothetical protein